MNKWDISGDTLDQSKMKIIVEIIFLAALQMDNVGEKNTPMVSMGTANHSAPQSWDTIHLLNATTYLQTSSQPDSAITYVCSVRYLCTH